MFCSNCGKEMPDNFKFCSGCGAKLLLAPPQTSDPTPVTELDEEGLTKITDNTGQTIEAERPSVSEKIYFKGEGELIIKKIEHRGYGRKIGSWLVAGPIGYLAFGRDKTKKSKAKGTLAVTEKAIYCAGNAYPFDKVLSIAKTGTIQKSVLINFQSDVGGQRYDIQMEIKTKEMDRLFAALESARMSKVGF